MAYFARKFDDGGMNSVSNALHFCDHLKAIGTTIRELRWQQGFSQEELAYLAAIDRSHMGKIERGERNVSIVNLIRIAGALSCPPSELLSRAGI